MVRLRSANLATHARNNRRSYLSVCVKMMQIHTEIKPKMFNLRTTTQIQNTGAWARHTPSLSMEEMTHEAALLVLFLSEIYSWRSFLSEDFRVTR